MGKFIFVAIMLIAAAMFTGASTQKAEAQGYYGTGRLHTPPGHHQYKRGYPYYYSGRHWRYNHQGGYYNHRRKHCFRRAGWRDSYGVWHQGRRHCGWRYY